MSSKTVCVLIWDSFIESFIDLSLGDDSDMLQFWIDNGFALVKSTGHEVQSAASLHLIFLHITFTLGL